ncbi:hypothetical protein MHYP_G00078490 [Metynnis hypsauchen]
MAAENKPEGLKKIRNPDRMYRSAVCYSGHAPPKGVSDDTEMNNEHGHLKIYLPKKLLECLPKCSSLPKERHRWNTNENPLPRFLSARFAPRSSSWGMTSILPNIPVEMKIFLREGHHTRRALILHPFKIQQTQLPLQLRKAEALEMAFGMTLSHPCHFEESTPLYRISPSSC